MLMINIQIDNQLLNESDDRLSLFEIQRDPLQVGLPLWTAANVEHLLSHG